MPLKIIDLKPDTKNAKLGRWAPVSQEHVTGK
jgi:hypothetical protein